MLDPIVQALKDERIKQGVFKRGVAKKMKVANSALVGWEDGTKSPTLKSLRKWAEALGKDLMLRPLELELNQVARPVDNYTFDAWMESIMLHFYNKEKFKPGHLEFTLEEQHKVRRIWGTNFRLFLQFDVDADKWYVLLQDPKLKDVEPFTPWIAVNF